MLWWNLSKQNIWMMCPPVDKETTDCTQLDTVILSIEEEVEVVEEEESCLRKDKWRDPLEDLAEDMVELII